MKRGTIILGAIIFLLAGSTYAQQTRIQEQIPPNASQLTLAQNDIAVTDIYTDKNCILWIKFENKGNTRIHTNLHVKLWINERLIRDEDMLFDDFQAGKWRSHGYTGVKAIKILKPSKIEAFVDTTNKLAETNESNNTLTKSLRGCNNALLPL